MKKLMAVIVAVMMMAGCVSAFAAGNPMTEEEAMQAALDYAGLKAEQVTFTKVQMDRDDGRQVYEIEFVYNGIEYEMNVDRHDHDWDDLFDFDRD